MSVMAEEDEREREGAMGNGRGVGNRGKGREEGGETEGEGWKREEDGGEREERVRRGREGRRGWKRFHGRIEAPGKIRLVGTRDTG